MLVTFDIPYQSLALEQGRRAPRSSSNIKTHIHCGLVMLVTLLNVSYTPLCVMLVTLLQVSQIPYQSLALERWAQSAQKF